MSTLIHLCDPSANTALRDRYFHGIDLDFSKCTFLFSYNSAAKISPILLDRIKLAMPAPSDAERAEIVRAHILPRAQARLHTKLSALSDDAMALLLRRAAGGLRGVEKEVDHVLASAQLLRGGAQRAVPSLTTARASRRATPTAPWGRPGARVRCRRSTGRTPSAATCRLACT